MSGALRLLFQTTSCTNNVFNFEGGFACVTYGCLVRFSEYFENLLQALWLLHSPGVGMWVIDGTMKELREDIPIELWDSKYGN